MLLSRRRTRTAPLESIESRTPQVDTRKSNRPSRLLPPRKPSSAPGQTFLPHSDREFAGFSEGCAARKALLVPMSYYVQTVSIQGNARFGRAARALAPDLTKWPIAEAFLPRGCRNWSSMFRKQRGVE